MNIIIDGKSCSCEKGEYLLQIARRNGIEIPTLCHHDGFPGQGSCRLCIVEVSERGRNKVVVSCVYPVNQECEVFTQSERIKKDRRMILTLLMKRAPDSPEIRALCEKYGAPDIPRFVSVNGSAKSCPSAPSPPSTGASPKKSRRPIMRKAPSVWAAAAVPMSVPPAQSIFPKQKIPVPSGEKPSA